MNNLFLSTVDNKEPKQIKYKDYGAEKTEISNSNEGLKIIRRSINNKKELDEIIRRFQELCNLSTKEKIWSFQDEYTDLHSLIQMGISIDDIMYKEEIINNLFLYFNKFGISKEEIISKIDELEFFISDINLGYNGKLVETCDRIGIDVSYANFSDDGTFIGFKPKLKDFLIHTLTHEFLHKLSEKSNEIKILFRYQDALSEGYTDMFAHLVSQKTNIRSELYEFPEKICRLFSEMIGMEKTVNDYLYNSQDFPNLRKLFLECGCEKFSIFKELFDTIIKVSTVDKENGKTGCLALKEKDACLCFIIDNILFPYCRKNPDKVSSVLDKFNTLFYAYGYKIGIDDIKLNERNK